MQDYRKQEDPVAFLSLAMSNNGFDRTSFIIEANAKVYKEVTSIVEKEGKMLIVAIGANLGKSRIQSKSQLTVSISQNSTLDVLISYVNKMNSFTYQSCHSSSFEYLTSNNIKNKHMTLKELIKE